MRHLYACYFGDAQWERLAQALRGQYSDIARKWATYAQ